MEFLHLTSCLGISPEEAFGMAIKAYELAHED